MHVVSQAYARPFDDTALWRSRAALWIAILGALRVVGAAATSLTDTEAYYASWAGFPDLSYYDHPPMVAWTARAVGAFASTPLALRLTPIACAALTSLLLFELGSRFFSPRAAFLAVALHTAIPAYFFAALLVNPEATLAPSWMLALLALDELRRARDARAPLALGAAIGFAFLSKYSAVLLVPVSVLVVVTTRDARHWLRRPSFWLGGLVALAVASPVVLWNALRGWPSVQLHCVERAVPMSRIELLHHLDDLAVGQLLLYHPLLAPWLVTAAAVALVRAPSDTRYRFLACTSVPVLAFFGITMARVPDAEPHWTMTGFLPLLVAAGGLAEEALERLPRVVPALLGSLAVGTGALVLATLAHAGTDAFERWLPRALYDVNDDAMHETLGWDHLRDAVREEAARLGPGTVVAAGHNVLCGHLLYALDDVPRVRCPSARRTELDFVGRGDVAPEVPVVFVEASRSPANHEDALPDRRCRQVRSVGVARADREVARYALFACDP